jgi:eukaryotic-like serine/threonine-protein kinase
MTDEAQARLGTRLGNYALKEIIGRGGMGVVYRASHIYIRKPAAVKVLHRHLFSEPGAKARFLGEAQAASLVEHPNIVGVTDFGEAPDGTVYLVMAEAHGMGLDLILEKEGTLPLFRTIGIMGQVAHALATVHAHGIVHRDIKPENIMLAPRGGRREIARQMKNGDETVTQIEREGRFDLVTILDFGAARMLQSDYHASGEQARAFGTPAYMAPETAQHGQADASSDIYSVGVLFYEMLTGQLPFDSANVAETIRMHINDAPEPPRRRNPNVEITEEAERVILRALEKKPARRQSSMDDLWNDLQHCYGGMRWRRPDAATELGLGFEKLRSHPVGPTGSLRRPPRPAPDHSFSALHTRPPSEASPRPVLLTRRKSELEQAAMSPEDKPTPPPARPFGFGTFAKLR